MIKWKENANPKTVHEAFQLAKMGYDGGIVITLALQPADDDFHDWMDYCGLITCLYNRDNDDQVLLSALRKNYICMQVHNI